MNIKKDVQAVLLRLGVSSHEIAETSVLFNQIMAMRHVVKLRNAVGAELKDKPDALRPFTEDLNVVFDVRALTTPTAAQCRRLLTRHSLGRSPFVDLVDDLEHFHNTKDFKRPETWEGSP
jgi:hypothetical protein